MLRLCRCTLLPPLHFTLHFTEASVRLLCFCFRKIKEEKIHKTIRTTTGKWKEMGAIGAQNRSASAAYLSGIIDFYIRPLYRFDSPSFSFNLFLPAARPQGIIQVFFFFYFIPDNCLFLVLFSCCSTFRVHRHVMIMRLFLSLLSFFLLFAGGNVPFLSK